MTNAFEAYKKARQTNLDALVKQIEKENTTGGDFKDDREWRYTPDKSGNAHAVIRFLPTADPVNEPVPWAKYYSHGFKNPDNGRWYIQPCPTTFGMDCPVYKQAA